LGLILSWRGVLKSAGLDLCAPFLLFLPVNGGPVFFFVEMGGHWQVSLLMPIPSSRLHQPAGLSWNPSLPRSSRGAAQPLSSRQSEGRKAPPVGQAKRGRREAAREARHRQGGGHEHALPLAHTPALHCHAMPFRTRKESHAVSEYGWHAVLV
jgi:hypothetical protein